MSSPARGLLLPSIALAVILAGLALAASPASAWTSRVWMAGLILTGLPVLIRTALSVAKGRLAADLVAAMAIVASVVLDQPLPGLIVVLMQTGGEAMERYAERRATAAVRALEAAAPRLAHQVTDGGIVDLPVESVQLGDQLLIRPGEMVPCDCTVQNGQSLVDASRLTGEPLPVHARAGVALMSGSLNGHAPLTVECTALASQSQYARIVALVREAQASKAPLQRVADRYAVWFTPATVAVCLVAWLWSGDATRILAVLVVATPCPLILATPVAVIGGINRAASLSIIFRHGAAIEQLGQVRVALFDKTGTLTIGRPAVSRVVANAPFTTGELLRLAGAVEQHSSHLLGRTVVDAAVAEGMALAAAVGVVETPGRGVSGLVEGRRVLVGALGWLTESAAAAGALLGTMGGDRGGLCAGVIVDGQPAGLIEFADQIRPDVPALLADLTRLGVTRTMLLTGDRLATAEVVARAAGISEVHADLLPGDKVAIVAGLIEAGEKVMMVGDGTNDAPALSRATVGVALAAHGGGISAEAADVVILADELRELSTAVAISRRTLRIARQSITVGLGLSLVAMVVAAAGGLRPVAGALLQEVIDVAVILNALRASRPVAA